MQIQTYATEAEEREKSEFKTIDLKRSMTYNILCGLNTNFHSKPRINNKLEVQTELCSQANIKKKKKLLLVHHYFQMVHFPTFKLIQISST